MNGSTLTLSLVGALAVGAALGRRGSRARSTLPAGYRTYTFSDDDSQPGDEARENKARALAKKVGIGILRGKNLRIVVQKGSKVVGALFDELGGSYSFDFVVDPAVQGTGIGRWLVNEADQLAREYEGMGYASVIEAVNPLAQAMLVRRGFTVTDRGDGYAILERGNLSDVEWQR
jgi:GNAT superfamily N-acetyltransferase